MADFGGAPVVMDFWHGSHTVAGLESKRYGSQLAVQEIWNSKMALTNRLDMTQHVG